MTTITNATELQAAIQKLESEKVVQAFLLKEECVQLLNKFNPMNLIEDQLENSSTSASDGQKTGAVWIGWLSGYLIKKWITGNTNNPIRRIIGSAVQVWIANQIALHSSKIDIVVRNLFQFIIHKNK
jgi:hypothetical protein